MDCMGIVIFLCGICVNGTAWIGGPSVCLCVCVRETTVILPDGACTQNNIISYYSFDLVAFSPEGSGLDIHFNGT